MSKKTVFVGLSGGVDSSVAAWRLLQQGYDVVGVFIKVWQPEFLECGWEAERLDAMRVAAHLGIPFLTCDAEEAYKKDVGEFFIAEYKAGRTPNPDVMCNQHVKFGAFLDFAKAHQADYIATGHYAQVKAINTDSARSDLALWRGVDTEKDQSYFLWTLTSEQLQHVLLPVGDTTKSQIRQEAAAAKLPVAQKKDSQGICFLGQVDIPEFLSHFVDLQKGNVLDESGQPIGNHQGALVYTIGQRHGFTVHTQDAARSSYYVVAKDLQTNTITVSKTPPVTEPLEVIALYNCNWIEAEPEINTPLLAQFRYRQTPFVVTYVGDQQIKLTEPVAAAAAGQSCVLYAGDRCLGGGMIA